MSFSFVLTGGGTGGHIFPALAVARVLKERDHSCLFIGTREGMEAQIIPAAGYAMEFIRSSGLNRVGLRQQMQTALQLPFSIAGAARILRSFKPAAVFSMGGYVAGPVMLAALVLRIPLVVMEPNAIPGFANRQVGKRVYRALIGFEGTRRWFPAERCEVTGLPVRPEFFALGRKIGDEFTVLLTGGSRGARKLNQAARASWPLFRESRLPIRIIHQAGVNEYAALAGEFAAAGMNGEVVPFIQDMAGAFGSADLVVGRAGAGAVNEIAAAGMASILVPFPFAADDHQKRNAEALVQAGAARMILDQNLTGERLFAEVSALYHQPAELSGMREKLKAFAHPGAAERAAAVLEEAAQG
jgi:UDP-N-acetylglucosamine--N-acetylmuramyl-(pentapeptide) pyrophosphoryl-undecaprenol N-acetylglucosamine transferase